MALFNKFVAFNNFYKLFSICGFYVIGFVLYGMRSQLFLIGWYMAFLIKYMAFFDKIKIIMAFFDKIKIIMAFFDKIMFVLWLFLIRLCLFYGFF